MSDSVRPHRRQPTRLPCPWDPPGKNTGVGCHFLLQCMKVKSESEVTQSSPTPGDPMDCSLPGSSVHGIFQARVLEWGAIAFSVKAANAPQKRSSPSTPKEYQGLREREEGICLKRQLIAFSNFLKLHILYKLLKQSLLHHQLYKILCVRLCWWLSGKKSACQCRRHRFDTWSRKIPHATEK